MTTKYKVAAALCALLLLPGQGRAQTAWDSPLLLPPRAADGLGIFLTDMHAGGIGIMGTWQVPGWNYGVRAGISEGPAGNDLAVFGGVDYSGVVNRATADFPVDVDWVFGAGLALSDGARVSFPLGLSAGYGFQTESARFTPFLTPRVVLDTYFGRQEGDGPNHGAGLGIAVDLGLDLTLPQDGGPFGGTTVRFGLSVGDRVGVGVGVIF
jgi:hypothetical protein